MKLLRPLLVTAGLALAAAAAALLLPGEAIEPVACEPAVVEEAPPPAAANEPVSIARGWVGVLQAERSADIRAPFAARIQSIEVELSQPVEAGRPLLELDPTRIELERQAAMQAQHAAEASVRRAAARYEAARAKHQRTRKLHERALVAAEELEDAQADERIAKLEVEAAKAESASLRAQLGAREVDEAEATLLAPFAGVVVGRYAQQGERVEAGAALLRIADPGRLQVRFAVPEEDVGTLVVGAPLSVRPASGGATVPAVLARVAAEIDPTARVAVAEATIDDVPATWPVGVTLEVLPSPGASP